MLSTNEMNQSADVEKEPSLPDLPRAASKKDDVRERRSMLPAPHPNLWKQKNMHAIQCDCTEKVRMFSAGEVEREGHVVE